MSSVVITGASSGFGRAAAKYFADAGFDLVLLARRADRLAEVKAALSDQVDVVTIALDVRNKVDVSSSLTTLPDGVSEVSILINSAGLALGLGGADAADLDDWDAMIDGNVKGVMYVTKAILPQMTERKKGHIINIGSIAGFEVYPKGNVYCASKFAIDAFTKGLRIDLNPYGIRVGAINPGLVETEFSEVRFKGDEDRAASVYSKLDALQAEDIANTILFMIHAPEHVTLADITILPTAQASATVLNKRV